MGPAVAHVTRRIIRWVRNTTRKICRCATSCFRPPPRLQALQRTREAGGSGASIRAYALHLAADKTTTFAQNIDNFIACTRESRETRPQVVMRNMRQFMSGMKNYLVKHGEREFEKEVERERGKLRANEFLNLDAILEGVMHKLVVRPLKEHLYRLFVDEYTANGAIQLLADNIQYARTKPLHELGIRSKVIPPSEEALTTICHYLNRLQEVDSPLEKLENLLTCISAIFNSVKTSNAGRGGLTLGADDFLPLFVWVLVQSGMVAAEIEAEYMWGLLHPSLLSGEGGYYLTTLSSAVHVLKNFRACSEETSAGGGNHDVSSPLPQMIFNINNNWDFDIDVLDVLEDLNLRLLFGNGTEDEDLDDYLYRSGNKETFCFITTTMSVTDSEDTSSYQDIAVVIENEEISSYENVTTSGSENEETSSYENVIAASENEETSSYENVPALTVSDDEEISSFENAAATSHENNLKSSDNNEGQSHGDIIQLSEQHEDYDSESSENEDTSSYEDAVAMPKDSFSISKKEYIDLEFEDCAHDMSEFVVMPCGSIILKF